MKLGRKLIVGYLLIAILVTVVAYVGLRRTEHALQKVITESSGHVAIEMLDQIDRSIHCRLEEWLVRANDSVLLKESLRSSNRAFEDIDDVPAYVRRLDAEWTGTPEGSTSPFMTAMLKTPLSRQLQERVGFYQERYQYALLGEVFAANRYGANVGMSQRTTDFDQSDEFWWQQAMQRGLYVGDLGHDRSAGIHSITLAVRVDESDDSPLGVVKVVLNIQEALAVIEQMAASQSPAPDGLPAVYRLVTGEGRLICSTEGSATLTDVSADVPDRDALTPGEPRIATRRDDEHGAILSVQVRSGGYRDFDGLGWILVVDHRANTIFAPVRRLRRQILFTGAAVLALAVLIGWRVSRSIARPTTRLIEGTRAVGAGHLDHKVGTSATDEIGELSQAFDQMTERLRSITVSRDELAVMNERLQHEIAERKLAERELHRIEWLLTKEAPSTPPLQAQHVPDYGDPTQLNNCRVLLDSVGRETFQDIVGDYLHLLGTSAAVYEKNGDYALGIFSSGWCRFLDEASRRQCGTDDNREALACGKWCCHESCWTDASKRSIEERQPVDIECRGGIRLHAVPILAGENVVGSINFGYGDPPIDAAKLREIADRYHVRVEDLRAQADAYESRPVFIIELAKSRLLTAAKLVGEIVERRQAETRIAHLNAVLAAIRNVNQTIARATTAEVLIRESCDRMIETRGYAAVWAVLLDDEGRVTTSAEAGFGENFADLQRALDNGALPHCSREALGRSGVVVTENGNAECAPCPLSSMSDHLTNMSVRLHSDGRTYGVLSASVSPTAAEDAEEQSLLTEVASDIALALNRLEQQEERQKAEDATRQSEERFRALVDLAPDVIYRLDAEGRIVFVGQAVREFGYSPAELVGRPLIDLVHPDDRDRWQRSIVERRVGERVTRELEIRLRRNAGPLGDAASEFADCEVSARGVWNVPDDEISRPDKIFLGSQGIIHDITNRKRNERELAKYRQQLEGLVSERTKALESANEQLHEAVQDLEAFCYSVSHDLRAPLRAIDGFSRAVVEDHADQLDAEGRRYLSIISDSTHRMGQLISDLLGFSFLGRKELKSTVVRTSELVDEVWEELRSTVPDRDVALVTGEMPLLYGDRPMLREVFLNLLSNAIKFTRSKSQARIEVSGAALDDTVRFQVADNGVGFDMNYVDKLFGVFERLHTSDEFEGTGVGLAIVKRVIQRHGGRVWATAEVDRGATFHFELPKGDLSP